MEKDIIKKINNKKSARFLRQKNHAGTTTCGHHERWAEKTAGCVMAKSGGASFFLDFFVSFCIKYPHLKNVSILGNTW
jgi:hypothetical protein